MCREIWRDLIGHFGWRHLVQKLADGIALIGYRKSEGTVMTKHGSRIYTEPLPGGFIHWDRDKMDTISQTAFWSAFSWMKMFEFRFQFHWNLFQRVQLTIFQHWFRWWLGAVQATSHFLNERWLNYRRIYAWLGLNELISYQNVMAPLLSVNTFRDQVVDLHCYANGDCLPTD